MTEVGGRGGPADRRTDGARRSFTIGAPGGTGNRELPLRLGGTAISVIVHAVVLALLLVLYRPHLVERRVTMIPLDVGEPLALPVPSYVPPAESVPSQRAERRQVTPPILPRVADVPPVVVARAGAGRRDSAGVRRPAARARVRIGPGFGDGRLWVPPVDVLQLGRVLPRESGGGPMGVAELENLVTARLLAYLDSMPPDSFAPPSAPKWTTEIAGKTWGIDGRWIYLGGLKLPAALLALLPVPTQNNYDQARAARDLQRMREDILQAAQRADNAAEFKRYVDELRKRRDAEREMRRRVPRDTIIP